MSDNDPVPHGLLFESHLFQGIEPKPLLRAFTHLRLSIFGVWSIFLVDLQLHWRWHRHQHLQEGGHGAHPDGAGRQGCLHRLRGALPSLLPPLHCVCRLVDFMGILIVTIVAWFWCIMEMYMGGWWYYCNVCHWWYETDLVWIGIGQRMRYLDEGALDWMWRDMSANKQHNKRALLRPRCNFDFFYLPVKVG